MLFTGILLVLYLSVDRYNQRGGGGMQSLYEYCRDRVNNAKIPGLRFTKERRTYDQVCECLLITD